MNFDYTDDQKALKEEARRFLTAASPLTVARAVLENPGDGYDVALWGRIVEQGWCGATIPEAYGGLGLGYVELCALAEELGRAVAPVPFASSIYFFAEALMLAGSEATEIGIAALGRKRRTDRHAGSIRRCRRADRSADIGKSFRRETFWHQAAGG